MTIPTTGSLARSARRLDRRSRGMAAVLGQMQRGASLRKHFARGRPVCVLSTGGEVPPDIAALAIAHPDVVGVGDALLGCELGQTFRYAKS